MNTPYTEAAWSLKEPNGLPTTGSMLIPTSGDNCSSKKKWLDTQTVGMRTKVTGLWTNPTAMSM